VKTIAVLGLSDNPARPSFHVAQAMQGFGYRIVPVRPVQTTVLGEQAYASLADVPSVPDVVDVFRAPEHVPGIVRMHRQGRQALWLQEGGHETAAEGSRGTRGHGPHLQEYVHC
jgi:predicted CoA-binding protein